MTPSCPSCQAPFVPGAQTCGACGAALLVAPTPGSSEPVCAVHPQWRSVGTCARCGAFACASCLRQGTEGVVCASCHDRAPMGTVPWDRRGELGTLKAFWQTCLGMLMRPTETLKGINPDAPVSSSMGFVLMTGVAGFVTTGLLYAVIFGGILAFVPAPEANTEANPMGSSGAKVFLVLGMLAWAAAMPFVNAGMTFVMAGMDHLLLRMGGVERGFSVTMRAHALSLAPYIVGIIPFVALYSAPFWAMGLRVVTYRTLHRTTWGTAAAGALLAPVLSCCICGGGYAAIMFAVFKGVSGSGD
ncbi:zinc ribbon domain-containing protein [Corallococcus sp. ZKHCc1 1396]|uniref:Zinc ribbon domain-containing protein n=1 Tax=Corallococcus soli TaxID=2710757 RepID=A0ABR9PFH4_9BACT|nr:zinc ribbon domain-containing protein [Corallococcus soli]MBE4746668.1 zinc ribbon domain-containing protein [Corallococcus soli]